MSDREFKFVKVQREGAAKSAMRITCIECGGTEDFLQTNGKRLPPIAAAQHFRKRGWYVGSTAKADNCPACIKGTFGHALANAVNADKEHCVIDFVPTVPDRVITVDEPAGPTREDRRIIFSKLQDVYLDEKLGYDAGWTDHRVSEDLGVPRAWVASVRDENFGPAKDNADIRQFLESLSSLQSEWDAATKAVEEESRKLAANLAWQSCVADRLRDLERLAKNVKSQIAA